MGRVVGGGCGRCWEMEMEVWDGRGRPRSTCEVVDVEKVLLSIDATQSMSCRNVQPGIETRRAGQGCDGFRLLRCSVASAWWLVPVLVSSESPLFTVSQRWSPDSDCTSRIMHGVLRVSAIAIRWTHGPCPSFLHAGTLTWCDASRLAQMGPGSLRSFLQKHLSLQNIPVGR